MVNISRKGWVILSLQFASMHRKLCLSQRCWWRSGSSQTKDNAYFMYLAVTPHTPPLPQHTNGVWKERCVLSSVSSLVVFPLHFIRLLSILFSLANGFKINSQVDPGSKVIGFRISIYQCGFWIPDSNSKNFVDSGFLLLWHGARQERLMTCCFRTDRF